MMYYDDISRDIYVFERLSRNFASSDNIKCPSSDDIYM